MQAVTPEPQLKTKKQSVLEIHLEKITFRSLEDLSNVPLRHCAKGKFIEDGTCPERKPTRGSDSVPLKRPALLASNKVIHILNVLIFQMLS
jgi:hypothetical protein